MRLAAWRWGDRPHAGTVSSDGRELTPLAVEDAARGALELIARLARGEALPPPAGPRVLASAVTLTSPLPRPRRGLFCVGRNYRAHAQELAGTVFSAKGGEVGEWPIVFTKFAECVVGPFDAIRLPLPSVSTQIDYESELAVVIGRGGHDIPKSRAMDHVCGWTVVN